MAWLASLFVIGLAALVARLTGTPFDGAYCLDFASNQWLLLITLLAWSPLLVYVLRRLLRLVFRVRRHLFELPVTDSSAKSVRRAVSLLGATALWYTFAPIEELPFPQRVEDVLHFVLIASSVWLIVSIWEGFCDSLTIRHTNLDHRAEKLLIPVTRKLVRVVLLLGGALILLSTYSVDWKGILAGLGLGGLVVALAAKDSVENIFGSITILFDMPFALGDWVKIGTVDGIVEEINLRSTRIRTAEDSIITLPNSNLIKASVENMGARRTRRQRFQIRLSYETRAQNVEKLTKALIKHLDTQRSVARGRSTVAINDFGELSFGVLVQCYFEVGDLQQELDLRGEIMSQILKLAEESGAEFFNGQTWKKEA